MLFKAHCFCHFLFKKTHYYNIMHYYNYLKLSCADFSSAYFFKKECISLSNLKKCTFLKGNRVVIYFLKVSLSFEGIKNANLDKLHSNAKHINLSTIITACFFKEKHSRTKQDQLQRRTCMSELCREQNYCNGEGKRQH